MSTNGAPLLALEGVSKRFGPVQALEGVDFEVRGGEVVALAKGDDVPSDLINQQVDNGQKEVPSVILTPVAVLKNNVNEVVKGGDVKAANLCKGKFASACEEAGISGT